eukprot:6835820-Ditylum_brightwellii.AAC.1
MPTRNIPEIPAPKGGASAIVLNGGVGHVPMINFSVMLEYLLRTYNMVEVVFDLEVLWHVPTHVTCPTSTIWGYEVDI